MTRLAVTVAAVALLGLNAGLHGHWSHRWVGWDGPTAKAALARLEDVPLRAGAWSGERIATDPLGLPEEQVGRGISVRYTDRTDGAVVDAYVACGPTDAAVGHVPTVCYPANGYTWCPPDRPAEWAGPGDGPGSEFRLSGFTRADATVPVHLRVFWAWSDGRGWRTPANPLRTFRHTPVLFKCYLIRQVPSSDEPTDGDPCARLWTALRPKLDQVLFERD